MHVTLSNCGVVAPVIFIGANSSYTIVNICERHCVELLLCHSLINILQAEPHTLEGSYFNLMHSYYSTSKVGVQAPSLVESYLPNSMRSTKIP